MSPRRGQFITTVVENTFLCREHYRLVLEAVNFPPTRAGQFIQISCRPVEQCAESRELAWPPKFGDDDVQAPLAVLRRPFSLAHD